MQIYKLSDFGEWAVEEGITDANLLKALAEMEQGLIDANLGGGLYKKRLSRKGQGKSGSYRTLIAFRQGHRTVFIYGFSKNEHENINRKEKEVFKKAARFYLDLDDIQISLLVRRRILVEIVK